jgi:hypothetical protein
VILIVIDSGQVVGDNIGRFYNQEAQWDFGPGFWWEGRLKYKINRYQSKEAQG